MENKRRNGKRDSGNFDQNIQGIGIERRTSKKGSSRDRHGHVYPEGYPETSIRTVTPDPPTDDMNPAKSPGGAPTSIATSPLSNNRSNGDKQDAGLGRLARAGAGIIAPRSAANGSRENSTRPRTRTLEERSRNQSPSSRTAKKRNRLGSLNAAGTLNMQESNESTSSIGFPSIIPSSSQQAPGRRLVKSPPRPLSPVMTHVGFPSFPVNHEMALPSPTTDTSRILSLMKTTCGRMHGILSTRTTKSGPWTSGYCAINVATGSLIYQVKGEISHTKTLVPDLRGCHVRTQGIKLSETGYLEVLNRNSGTGVHLRPHVVETFDSWLAALLCWQPLRPKGAQNKMTKPQPPAMPERKFGASRRNSGINLMKDAAIIKVGRMLFWDHNARITAPQSPTRISTYKQQRSASGTAWRRISATLQENGQLRLYSEADNTMLAMIPLSLLLRCAIQRLHPSVLEDEFCIALYPRYTASNDFMELKRPIYLSLENRVLFEVWFVLFRAFAIPELYGPEQLSIPSPAEIDSPATVSNNSSAANTENMFRMERLLSMRIVEAKVHTPSEANDLGPQNHSRSGAAFGSDMVLGDYHAEVYIDSEIRGRTAVKAETNNPFWREEYEFGDLPPVLSSAMVMLKSRNSGQRDWTLVSDEKFDPEDANIIENLNNMDIVGEIQISPLDTVIGVVDLNLDDLERSRDLEKWWPVLNERGEVVGDMLLKIRMDEATVLMSQEYRPLLELLHTFSNGLTQQIISTFPAAEVRKLPETMLNIFQVSGEATDWLMSLVEDEIDSLHKETTMSRFRYSRRIASNDSYDSGVEREMFLRDMNKNARGEANLLFRGNSLLTKALDAHMRRLGKDYLDETLGEKMRDIDESDPDCEVDPNRAQNSDALSRNWRNLIALTENVWKAIYTSVPRCPPELRQIFRHIRACAEDRYGDFMRSVGYSSVSGFLFLRFLCPAVLNPKLFGLLKDHPRPRAQRTLTLMAKSLQTLANMTTFGNKEPWMEPMNTFLNSHRQEFKDFVDEICSIPTERAGPAIPPSYATPITVLSRLPGTSREGFPSLPFLLDQAREFATLVAIWLDATADANDHPDASQRGTGSGSKEKDSKPAADLIKFNAFCHSIRQKTRDVLNRAEQAERPTGVLEVKWEELVSQMDRKMHLGRPRPQRYPTEPSYSSPYTHQPRRRTTTGSTATTHNDSTISLEASALSDVPVSSTSPDPLPLIPATALSDTPPGSGSGSLWGGAGAGSDEEEEEEEEEEDDDDDDERFPAHALSWGQTPTPAEEIEADEDEEDEDDLAPDDDETRDARTRRARRLGARSVGSSARSFENDDGAPSGPSEQSGALASAIGNNPLIPSSPREAARKLSDVWNFRRKGTSSEGEGSGSGSAGGGVGAVGPSVAAAALASSAENFISGGARSSRTRGGAGSGVSEKVRDRMREGHSQRHSQRNGNRTGRKSVATASSATGSVVTSSSGMTGSSATNLSSATKSSTTTASRMSEDRESETASAESKDGRTGKSKKGRKLSKD